MDAPRSARFIELLCQHAQLVVIAGGTLAQLHRPLCSVGAAPCVVHLPLQRQLRLQQTRDLRAQTLALVRVAAASQAAMHGGRDPDTPADAAPASGANVVVGARARLDLSSAV
jgi:hypothetical protein